MLSLYDEASIVAVMEQPIQPVLRSLLQARLDQTAAADLRSLTHLLVVQPGDTEAQIVTEIGFSPLVEPFEGARSGTAGFQPHWAWLHDLGGWYEMIVTVGDTGFAFVMLIEKSTGMLPDLLNMCEQYAGTVQCA